MWHQVNVDSYQPHEFDYICPMNSVIMFIHLLLVSLVLYFFNILVNMLIKYSWKSKVDLKKKTHSAQNSYTQKKCHQGFFSDFFFKQSDWLLLIALLGKKQWKEPLKWLPRMMERTSSRKGVQITSLYLFSCSMSLIIR